MIFVVLLRDGFAGGQRDLRVRGDGDGFAAGVDVEKYPDVLAVDADGKTYYPGARQHYSPCSPTYRRLAAALVKQFAKRYAKHPALASWHINNEYGCHMSECHGEASTRAWRVWLKKKYGTLEGLNAAWGTAFWSQHYYAWEEILTPRRAPYHPNPTQQLDFKRFMSGRILELCTMERDRSRARRRRRWRSRRTSWAF